MAGTSKGTSLYRPGHGWYLFGGNNLTTAQKLKDVDSEWEAGPKVEVIGNTFQCAVQVCMVL
jgi:hypothetical protein